jgi:hypothetical protein
LGQLDTLWSGRLSRSRLSSKPVGGMTDSSMCAQYISLVWNERLIRLERKPDKYRLIE